MPLKHADRKDIVPQNEDDTVWDKVLAEQDNSLAGEPSILNELEMYYKPAMEHVTAATMAAATMAEAGNSLQGFEADLVLLPLRLAFETKEPKLVETALDCLHLGRNLYPMDILREKLELKGVKIQPQLLKYLTWFVHHLLMMQQPLTV